MNLPRNIVAVTLVGALSIAARMDAADTSAPVSPANPPATAAPGTTGGKKRPALPPLPISKVASPARTRDNVEFVIGPDYAYAPELTARDDVPKGKVHEFTMSSEDSKIYPGIAKTQPGATVPYKRQVWVYVPSQYVAGAPAPVIVVQDGRGYSTFMPTMLDNMIHDRRLPAMIAIMINSGGGDAQGSQRGLEYDTVSGTYAMFIETEVLPRIERDYGVTFTRDPEGRATMGGSSGGAAAFTMAWFRPDLYRRVLTYSGTYVNQQSPVNPASPRGAWEYHATFIPQSERKPLRVWLHVSDQDNGATRDEASLHNWVMANQRMAAALKAKGYAYRFVFSEVSRHTDGRVTRQTLPGALEWLWEGYPRK
jgi:iron(III)-enterobactin esterase